MRRDRTRERIIRHAKKLRAEVQQIFTDCASWNDNVRKPNEEPIDPDPYGDMRRLLDRLDKMIENDPGRGPIAPLGFERSH